MSAIAARISRCGTNRVIAAGAAHGAAPPLFAEQQGFVAVTFRTDLVPGSATPQVPAQVTAHVAARLQAASPAPVSRKELQNAAGIKHREHFRMAHRELAPLRERWLAHAIPGKPRRRLQRYRTTEAGQAMLQPRPKDGAS